MKASIYLATGTASAVTAAIGSVAGQGANSTWFRRLHKPPFQPPAVVFPVVWTALYADIAVSSAHAIDRLNQHDRSADAQVYARALALNFVLSASWTWVFFRAHRLGTSVAVAAALAGSSADLVRRTGSASPAAGKALVPYAAWCTFATILSTAIWRRNRGK